MKLTPCLALVFLAALSASAFAQRAPVRAMPEPAVDVEKVDTFPVEFEFLAYEHRANEGRAGIELEIGVGKRSDPQHHVDRAVLTRVASGADGVARGVVHVPVEWQRDGAARIWARVASPGYAWSSAVRTLRPKDDERVTKLFVRSGGRLLGTVRSEDGAIVRDARVWLLRREPDRLTAVEATTEGRFAISFPESGDFALHVRAAGPGPGRGSGRVELEGLKLDEAPRSIDVEVTGGLALRGRVVDPDGAPVLGLQVLALPAGHTKVPSEALFAAFERSGGLWGGVASTNTSGAFEIPAVAPSDYDLYVSWAGVGFGHKGFRDGLDAKLERFVRVGTRAFDSGATPIELVFATHRIEVRLQAQNPPAPSVAAAAGGEPRLRLVSLPGERYARALGPEIGPFSMPPIVVGDVAVFPGHEPRATYLALWTDPEYARVERRVQPDPARYCRRVELDLGPRGAPAHLGIEVTDPEGHPIGGDGTGRDVRIVVETVDTHVELARSDSMGICSMSLIVNGGWAVSLPAGRVRVRASDESCARRGLSPHAPPSHYTPASVVVELEPGATRAVVLRLGEAGYLNFASNTGSVLPRLGLDDAEATEPLDLEPPLGDELQRWYFRAAERPRLQNGGGFATLTRAGEERVAPLHFQTSRGATTIGWIAPGMSAYCATPLPPGRWTLRVEDGERVLFETEVEIHAGETTVVRW